MGSACCSKPEDGMYDRSKSPVENIDLPPALLSRFDLIFLLLDTVDMDKDKQLAMHVTKVHSSYNSEGDVGAADDKSGEQEDTLNLGFKPFDHNFMRSFIRRAKELEPKIDDELQQ